MQIEESITTDFESVHELSSDDILQTLLANQKIILANQAVIMNDQKAIAKDSFDTKKLIHSCNHVAQLETSEPSQPALDFDLSAFNKIANEETLNAFEEKVREPKYRAQQIGNFVDSIGKNHRDLSTRNIALQVDGKMFERTFWATTAWTGGRTNPDGPKKFKLQNHTVFLSFFKDVIKNICGTLISDTDLVEFVKSRTRNSNYVPISGRKTAARKRQRTIGGDDDSGMTAATEHQNED